MPLLVPGQEEPGTYNLTWDDFYEFYGDTIARGREANLNKGMDEEDAEAWAHEEIFNRLEDRGVFISFNSE